MQNANLMKKLVASVAGMSSDVVKMIDEVKTGKLSVYRNNKEGKWVLDAPIGWFEELNPFDEAGMTTSEIDEATKNATWQAEMLNHALYNGFRFTADEIKVLAKVQVKGQTVRRYIVQQADEEGKKVIVFKRKDVIGMRSQLEYACFGKTSFGRKQELANLYQAGQMMLLLQNKLDVQQAIETEEIWFIKPTSHKGKTNKARQWSVVAKSIKQRGKYQVPQMEKPSKVHVIGQNGRKLRRHEAIKHLNLGEGATWDEINAAAIEQGSADVEYTAIHNHLAQPTAFDMIASMSNKFEHGSRTVNWKVLCGDKNGDHFKEDVEGIEGEALETIRTNLSLMGIHTTNVGNIRYSVVMNESDVPDVDYDATDAKWAAALEMLVRAKGTKSQRTPKKKFKNRKTGKKTPATWDFAPNVSWMDFAYNMVPVPVFEGDGYLTGIYGTIGGISLKDKTYPWVNLADAPDKKHK